MSANNFIRKHKAPKIAGEVLESALAENKIKSKIKSYSALPQWKELVGDEIANVTKPDKILIGNNLIVKVLDASWLQELSMKKEEILDKLQRLNTGAFIQDITFVASDPKELGHR